jgi:hypothetical protein
MQTSSVLLLKWVTICEERKKDQIEEKTLNLYVAIGHSQYLRVSVRHSSTAASDATPCVGRYSGGLCRFYLFEVM